MFSLATEGCGKGMIAQIEAETEPDPVVTLAETTDDHGNDKSNVGTREFLKVSLMILVLITHWRSPIQQRPVRRYGNRGC